MPHDDVGAVGARWPRPATGGRWSSSSRSTRCSATRRRWPSWPPRASEYDALLVVDEAHGLGVRGPGLVRRARPGRPAARARDATLSKALGSQGGRCSGRRRCRPPGQPGAAVHLRHRPRAGCRRRRRSRRCGCCGPGPSSPTSYAAMADLAAALGVAPSAGAVLSVPMPSPGGRRGAGRGAGAGRAVGCFRPPSVPDGVSRLRVTVSAGSPRPTGCARSTSSWRSSRSTHDSWSSSPAPPPASARRCYRRARRHRRRGSVVVVKPVQTGVGRRRLRRPRGRPADRGRGRRSGPARRAAGPRHRRPAAGRRIPRWRLRRPHRGAAPATRWSSRGPAGCWCGSTPTAARSSTSPPA